VKQSKFRRFLRAIGPGFITGSADDDPSGIGTYAQTGAQFGYAQLWFALFVTPFMIAVQEMCGRIGLVTGKGLAGVIRAHYAKPLLYGVVFLLLLANTVNIGADLGAMADAAALVTGMPSVGWLIALTILILILEIFISYKTYARFLKILCLSLLAYIVAAFTVVQPWPEILRSTLVPTISFSREYLMNLVALFGTTISPYLFFWQAGEEVEEEVAHHLLQSMGRGTPRITSRILSSMRLDTISGMVFSNVITFFIITTSASTLGVHGIHTVSTAAEAAVMLQPLAPHFASLLFAAGVIGTGLLAVPILAGSASYAISEAFGWREGLSRTFRQAPAFYGVIILSTATGLLVNLLKLPAFEMLYYAAILNGIIAPPLIVIILVIGRSRRIMQEHVNTVLSDVFGWITAVAMTVAAAALLVSS
jgi:Mn2+/Fe2+ NRAMP family transporter